MAARTQAVLYGVQQLLENELAAADFEITGNVVYRYAGGAWISVFYLDPDTETGACYSRRRGSLTFTWIPIRRLGACYSRRHYFSLTVRNKREAKLLERTRIEIDSCLCVCFII
jgi:hypothetical protein